jgi:SAM-dependent methyltransferase
MTELGRDGAAVTAQVRQLFDAKAATWSAKYAPGGRLTGRLEQLRTAVGQRVSPGGTVLDLGCATGDLARELAAGGLRVAGCDISAQMLDRAARADPAGIAEWVRLEPGWRRLPFADAAFDAIVAASVLEYVSAPAAVLRECARVLRPEGTLLCTVPDLRHPVRWLEWPAGLLARSALARSALAGAVARVWGRVDGSPALDAYLTYLRISRQRRRHRWWLAAAGQAGLRPATRLAEPGRPAPLRLLALHRSAQPGEQS